MIIISKFRENPDDKKDFLEFEISILRFLWIGKLGKYFFGHLDFRYSKFRVVVNSFKQPYQGCH